MATKTSKFLTTIMNKFKLVNQVELGAFFSIPTPDICRYFNGERTPSYNRCLQMRDILKVNGFEIDISEIR